MRLRKVSLWLVVIGLASFVVLSHSPATRAEDAKKGGDKSVVGDVEVHESDANGKVKSVYLADTDEGDILVKDGGASADLLKHVGETVEAWGALEATDLDDFDYVMTVTRFEVVASDDDDDDEDPN
ncbi:MAG TPA: hypothetical protein VNI57_10930 [Candidatus Saccharimonadales bacterium]|nr:hypothetical protein [Candidatus Saccharimonadales bacterium]